MSFEIAIHQWREGERRLREAPGEQLPALERVTERIHDELRRRLGVPFTTDELVALYEQGTAWCTDLAYQVAPGAPWAWDARVVADAAFARYLREATDYAGGRRVLG
ncbi:MAG TPA: hypothetical protein VLA98_10735 [Solirubrobacteraceae bacterium]|nr:hypothetical protein [Solirubrobacteraceae bacterium]